MNRIIEAWQKLFSKSYWIIRFGIWRWSCFAIRSNGRLRNSWRTVRAATTENFLPHEHNLAISAHSALTSGRSVHDIRGACMPVALGRRSALSTSTNTLTYVWGSTIRPERCCREQVAAIAFDGDEDWEKEDRGLRRGLEISFLGKKPWVTHRSSVHQASMHHVRAKLVWAFDY